MKKILASVFVLVLVFALCSCVENGDVKSLLNGEKTFTDFETGKTADIFTLPEENTSYMGSPASYAVVDLDGDGSEELLVEYDTAGDTAVLRLSGGEYVAYYLSFRSRTGMKEDGTMSWSSGASNSGVQRLMFTDNGMEGIDILEHNTDDYIFTINGEKVSMEECNEAFQKQYAKKDVEWKPITADPSVKENQAEKEDKKENKVNETITVEEFGNLANGVWLDLQKYDYGYEIINITKEDVWRYKYGVYGTDNGINMQISEVKMVNGTYKLTLYSPGGYNEMYDIYEEEKYEYVDVKLSNGTMIVDGTREYTYFSNYEELEDMIKGEEKQSNDRGSKSDLEADNWYTLDDHSGIFWFQNAEPTSVVPMSDGEVYLVNYYPVCKECHYKSARMEMLGVSIYEPITETYRCSSCNISTYARFKIVY